jgi:hypothetical protein
MKRSRVAEEVGRAVDPAPCWAIAMLADEVHPAPCSAIAMLAEEVGRALSPILVSLLVEEHKKAQKGDVHAEHKSCRGSLERLSSAHLLTRSRRANLPALGYHLAFSPSPQKMSGREVLTSAGTSRRANLPALGYRLVLFPSLQIVSEREGRLISRCTGKIKMCMTMLNSIA